jgi:hypothetical protein
VDSLAFSGRFLHLYSLEMQLRIHGELDEQCPGRGKIRFPLFEETMWLLASQFSDTIQQHQWHAQKSEFSAFQLQGMRWEIPILVLLFLVLVLVRGVFFFSGFDFHFRFRFGFGLVWGLGLVSVFVLFLVSGLVSVLVPVLVLGLVSVSVLLSFFSHAGINLLSKWIKFYKAKKPRAIFSAQYVMDTLAAFLEGVPLPDRAAFTPVRVAI